MLRHWYGLVSPFQPSLLRSIFAAFLSLCFGLAAIFSGSLVSGQSYGTLCGKFGQNDLTMWRGPFSFFWQTWQFLWYTIRECTTPRGVISLIGLTILVNRIKVDGLPSQLLFLVAIEERKFELMRGTDAHDTSITNFGIDLKILVYTIKF
jgi:hypothetical protein